MDYLISVVFFVLLLGLLRRMLKSRDVVDYQLGVIAVFSVGYYCLPIWFKRLTPLRFEDDSVVGQVVLMFFLFAAWVVLGTWVGRRVVPLTVGLRTHNLDVVLTRHRRGVTLAAFGFYLYYYFTQQLTSYSSKNFEAFFSQRGTFSAILDTVADLSLGWMALAVALAWREHRRRELLWYGAMLGICIFLLLFVGQRLALLSPIVMLMAALVLTGQVKRANRMLGLCVVALLLVSPIAVAIRQSQNTASAQQAVSGFNYGDSPFATMFQSIIDRGDLIYVGVGMKPHIDASPLPGPNYYASVLVNPIPRALLPSDSKPYPLSTDGGPTGELSILAWRTLHSDNTGSLSAFGGLVAYREFRWVGLFLNGLGTGILFVFVARWLGGGGVLSSLYYVNLFVSFSVKKVPPSFWEALLALMPLLPFLAAVGVIEFVLSARNAPSTSRKERTFTRLR